MKIKYLIFYLLLSVSCLAAPVGTPALSVATSNGTVAGGFRMVSIATSATFTGTILGATATASRSYTFQAPPGATLLPIAYTVTAGSVEILTVL